VDYAFPLDPRAVLGVPADATLEQIRDAYRAKSKRYHPDAGGDEWAFRVVARSYELLCTARVMGRANEEMTRAPAAAEPRPRGATAPNRHVRAGVHDEGLAPERLVGIEQLRIRYELDSPMSLMLERPEDRNLSCTLNVTWPLPAAGTLDAAAARPIREALDGAFREAARQTAPTASSADDDEPARYVAWLSYSTARKADDAFKVLHAALRARGLGVVETIREVTIPRDWK
jgi:hypothetical protein